MEVKVLSEDTWQFIYRMWKTNIIEIGGSHIAIGNIVLGLIFTCLGYYAASLFSRRLADRLMKRLHKDPSFYPTLQTILFYTMLAIFTLFALSIANIPLSIFTVVGGTLAIGIGFGSQNVVSNFISGIILMFERPIKVGDYIEVDNTFGVVDTIGFRSTKINTSDNKSIIIPNSSFLEKSVVNWTYNTMDIRSSISVGVAYGSDTRLVEQLLLQAVESEKPLLRDPQTSVSFLDFANSMLNFSVSYSIGTYQIGDRGTIASRIRFQIDDLFRKNHVNMALPQRDLNPTKPIEVKVLN